MVLLICLAGVVLTMSKGAFLQLYIVFFMLNKQVHIALRAVFWLLPLFSISYFMQFRGVQIHVSGLVNSLDSASFLGYGIGSSGNYAKMFSNDLSMYSKLEISDTFIGALIGQLGLLLTVAWGMMMLFFIVKSTRFKEHLSSMKILISIICVSVLSENTLNVTTFLIPSILIGLAVNYEYNEHKAKRMMCKSKAR